MEILLEELVTFYDIPLNEQNCFFCLIDTVHWVSIDLGVLICSNCVATCRSLGTPTVSIKLDLIHITNELKRKVLINLGYDYTLPDNYLHEKKIEGLWKTRGYSKIKSKQDIKHFLEEKGDFINCLNIFSKLDINVFRKESVKPNLVVKKDVPKTKKWQIVEDSNESINNIQEPTNEDYKLEEQKPEETKQIKTVNESIKTKISCEKIFDEEDSSDVSIDYSSNLEVSKHNSITKVYKNNTTGNETTTYEKISANTKKAAKKVQEEVDRVFKKFI